jgi:aminomethyltransferase
LPERPDEPLLEEPVSQDLKQTPLTALHRERGAKLVPFAGYEMPVQFEGIIAEHRHTRTRASLFDVSHMGQATLEGEDAAAAMETLVPGDIHNLAQGRTRYTLLTNEAGGIVDDLMVTRQDDHLYLVFNASRKEIDLALIGAGVEGKARLSELKDWALMALQGPQAAQVLARLAPDSAAMAFMSARTLNIGGVPCLTTRSGYSGEDGFEISVPAASAEKIARLLLDEPEVEAAGLGARDTLRLEAGLCLYGNDIDETTTPVEAALSWTIAKSRRGDGGFPGAGIILEQLANGVARKRVGLLPDGKAPVRDHTAITGQDGAPIGEVTSGGYGPTMGGPVAMGYMDIDHAGTEVPVTFMVRGKPLPGRTRALPFVAHRYFKP